MVIGMFYFIKNYWLFYIMINNMDNMEFGIYLFIDWLNGKKEREKEKEKETETEK